MENNRISMCANEDPVSKRYVEETFDYAMSKSYNSDEPPYHRDYLPELFKDTFFTRLGTYAMFRYCLGNRLIAYYRPHNPPPLFATYDNFEIRIGTKAMLLHVHPMNSETMYIDRARFDRNGEIEDAIDKPNQTVFFDMHVMLRYGYDNQKLDRLLQALNPAMLDDSDKGELKKCISETEFEYEITGYIDGEYFVEKIIHNQMDKGCMEYSCPVSSLKPFNKSTLVSLQQMGKDCFVFKDDYKTDNIHEFQYSKTPITLTEMSHRMNELLGKGTVSVRLIKFQLMNLGYIQTRYADGHKYFTATRKGLVRGFINEDSGMAENSLPKVLYNPRAQRLILRCMYKVFENRKNEEIA